jgi:hypothetical protein
MMFSLIRKFGKRAKHYLFAHHVVDSVYSREVGIEGKADCDK